MKILSALTLTTVCLISILLLAVTADTATAYERYSSCATCHGAFSGPTSTKVPPTVFPEDSKHAMHGRTGNYMQTDCDLCHQSGDSKNPFIGSSDGIAGEVPGLGCTGCHLAEGLRAHHIINGESCGGCHDAPVPEPENTIPPYYGTAYTLANNPCNDVQASNTNENWSVGDFIGTDNDGDNLFDQADFDCGPPYTLVSAVRVGDDLRVSWETAGGRTDILQAAATVDGTYSPVVTITNAGVGVMTNEYLEVGGALSAARFYRISSP